MDETYQLIPSTEVPRRSLEQMLDAWMHAKFEYGSKSKKTRDAYLYVMKSFRATLGTYGYDLDGPARPIAEIAQAWSVRPHPHAKNQEDVSETTINQRLSVISSSYRYILRMYRDETTITENPIERLQRPKVRAYEHTQAVAAEDIQAILRKIDRTTTEGQQAYAIISIAVTTGRRVSEIANMKMADLTIRNEKVLVIFPRAKGAKEMKDSLAPLTAKMLLSYLRSWYGDDLIQLPVDTRVWVTLDGNQYHGKPMSVRTMQRIGERFCGAHFHTLRATFAITMERSGARVSEIQERLGHESLATTGRYLAAIKSAENVYGNQMERLYGMEE